MGFLRENLLAHFSIMYFVFKGPWTAHNDVPTVIIIVIAMAAIIVFDGRLFRHSGVGRARSEGRRTMGDGRRVKHFWSCVENLDGFAVAVGIVCGFVDESYIYVLNNVPGKW